MLNENSEKVQKIYESMGGWLNDPDWPFWYGKFGDSQYIMASSEPSGLVVTGKVDDELWTGWLTVFCSKLSLALATEIHDIEM